MTTPQNPFASEWLDSRQFAAEIGVAAVTLKAWRAVGTGPAYVKLGRLIRYRRSAVAAWLTSRTVTSAGPVSTS